MASRPRYPGQIRQVSTVFFLDLPAEIQTDVATCLKFRLERIHNITDGEAIWPDDVRELLSTLNPKLPLLLVDTALLVKAHREIYEDKLIEYFEVWETGEAKFPPVVIDSESEEVLCEGGHRSFSAFEAGVKAIEAVDVASIDAKLISSLLPRTYKITLTKDAEKQYVKLNKGLQRKIDELIARLHDWPEVSGAIPLWGPAKGHIRLKSQDWRVIFHVDEAGREIFIDKIANRRDAYEEYHHD